MGTVVRRLIILKQSKIWPGLDFKQKVDFSQRKRTKKRSIQMDNKSTNSNSGQSESAGSDNRTEAPWAKYRSWMPVDGDKTASPGLSFKVASYNILAQELLQQHLLIYKYCNPLHLNESYRLSRVIEEITFLKPDILCLQEVQKGCLEELMKTIGKKLNLTCIYAKKTGTKVDGCAIFYNDVLFEIVSKKTVEFYRPNYEPLRRDNIGLIAKLRCKAMNQATFLVCTTHLLYNPKRQDVRLAQLMVFLAEIERQSVATENEDGSIERIPIILNGDFNFTPHCPQFEFIVTGNLFFENLTRYTLEQPKFVDASNLYGKRFLPPILGITDGSQYIERIRSSSESVSNINSTSQTNEEPFDQNLFSTGKLSHVLQLHSVYDHFSNELYGSTFQLKWITVDHLFLSKPKKKTNRQASLNLLSVYKLPTVDQCKMIGFLPNADFGSDHLVLASQIYITFPQ